MRQPAQGRRAQRGADRRTGDRAEPVLNALEIREAAERYFREHARSWGLDGARVGVRYVVSPGGFGPFNYTVSDGARAYHVKAPRRAERLDAWRRADPIISSRYRAPRWRGDVQLGDRVASVFDSLPGVTPDGGIPAATLDELVPLVRAMHADAELASALGGDPVVARSTFDAYYTWMFDHDLNELDSGGYPPFCDDALIAWMHDEVEVLRARAQRPAFDQPVSAPIHFDLWFGNVLVDGDSFWIIDWDDITIGDPAHDLGLMFLTEQPPFGRWIVDADRAFAERIELCARAGLLTFVTDPLTDWMEAEKHAAVTDSARAHREVLHRWALENYRARYG